MIKVNIDGTGELLKMRERAEMEINKEWFAKVGKEVEGEGGKGEEGGERVGGG